MFWRFAARSKVTRPVDEHRVDIECGQFIIRCCYFFAAWWLETWRTRKSDWKINKILWPGNMNEIVWMISYDMSSVLGSIKMDFSAFLFSWRSSSCNICIKLHLKRIKKPRKKNQQHPIRLRVCLTYVWWAKMKISGEIWFKGFICSDSIIKTTITEQ